MALGHANSDADPTVSDGECENNNEVSTPKNDPQLLQGVNF